MSLYNFTTATFTPGGSVGRAGPTLTQARDGLTGPEVNDWKNNTSYLDVSAGIMSWTVPKQGIYRINALGALGGGFALGVSGGLGARLIGDFILSQGDVVKILVGQKGNALDTGGAGGGGGTFVVKTPYNTTASILVIAGGGGGQNGPLNSNEGGGNALLTTNGGAPTSTVYGSPSGGTGGLGGGAITGAVNGAGGGGGGFTGNGQDVTNGGKGGASFTNGGLGGISNTSSANTHTTVGAFGGGGGGTQTSLAGGGGGGGYSGGAGAVWSGGGGGGSYNAGSNQVNTAAAGSGNGAVTITFFDQALSTPDSVVGVGATFIITLNTSDALNNTSVPYTITGVTTADINGASLTGNFAVVDNTATLAVVNTVVGQNTTKTFTITTSEATVSVTLTYLATGTQPQVPGTAVLTDAVTVTPNTTVVTTNSLSNNGVIVYSGISPLLSGVSQVLGAPIVPGVGEVTPLFEYLSIGFPRQILIR